LLAGLFGSAFVPVARAGAGASDATAAFTAGSANEDATATGVAYFSAASDAITAYTITSDGGDSGTYTVSVTGGTVKTCTSVSTGTASTMGAVNGSGCALAITDDADGGTTLVVITIAKLTAGASATVSLTNPAGTDLISAGTKTLTGVASTELAAVVSNSKTGDTFKWDADSNNTADTTDLSDTTISGVPYFAAGGEFGSVAEFRYTAKNGYDAGLNTDFTVIVEVTGSNYVACDDTVDGTIAAGSSALVALIVDVDPGAFECAVTAADGDDSTGGAWTATVKNAASGVVIDTVAGGFLGEIASVTLASTVTKMVAGHNADITDVFTITAKDASGRSYAALDIFDADARTSAAAAMYVYADSDTTAADITDTDLADADTDGIADLNFEVCGAGDAVSAAGVAKTKTVKIRLIDGGGDTVTSNAVTITCAVAAGTALVVEKLEWAASSVVPGGTVKARVYLEDANGNAAGAGDVQVDVPVVLTNGVLADITADSDVDTCTILAAGNYCEVTVTAPTTVGTVISLYSAAASSLVRTYVSSDAYEGALTVGPKKLKATADFGPAAGRKKIAFVLESASGTTKTFYRRANASGVATYTLNLRGTWTVYATFGDEISDTGTMRR
jgi:hypothetical protein